MTDQTTRFGASGPASDRAVLQSIPLLQGIRPQELKEMCLRCESQTVGPATDFIHFNSLNDRVFFLLAGTIRIYIHRDGKPEVVLAILGPGEVLGEISVLDGLPASVSVMTMEECQFATMQAADFIRCLERNTTFAFNLARLQNRRMRRITTHWQALATLNVDALLARQLLLFADDYGAPITARGPSPAVERRAGLPSKSVASGSTLRPRPRSERRRQATLIQLRLTQGDLAALCGASVRQINRIMLGYQKDAIIEIGRGHRITILNAEALRQKCL